MWKKILVVIAVLGGGAWMAKSWFDWRWKISHPIMKNIDRIQLYDPILKYNLNDPAERKMHFSTITGDQKHIDVAIFGCGSKSYAPFFDVILELAYDNISGNLNAVIINKGDNPIEISVDGKLIGTTDHVQQSEVYSSDVDALVRKKWVSFNFKNVIM